MNEIVDGIETLVQDLVDSSEATDEQEEFVLVSKSALIALVNKINDDLGADVAYDFEF